MAYGGGHRDSRKTDQDTTLQGRLQECPSRCMPWSPHPRARCSGTTFIFRWHPVILRRGYVHASDCCFWEHHISHGPAEGCLGEAPPACVSHLRRSSTICIRMQLLRICCVFWPVDPPGLPHLRIVARAEWSVIRAAGASMSHQSQLPGMATTPMQLQLLRHIALRFTSNLSMRAYITW